MMFFGSFVFRIIFWEQARDNLNGQWHMMCPHEIEKVKGYCLDFRRGMDEPLFGLRQGQSN